MVGRSATQLPRHVQTHWLRAIVACVVGMMAVVAAPPARAQEIAAQVDRNTISEDESVLLTISVSDRASVDIGLPTTEDFRVVGTQTSTSISMSGRHRQVTTQRAYRLAPLRTGTLSTGPVRVRTAAGVTRTDEYLVTVHPAGTRIAGNAPDPGPSAPRIRPNRTPTAPVAVSPDAADLAPRLPPLLAPEMFRVMQVPSARNEPFLVTMINRDRAYVGEPLVVDYLLALPLDVFDADVRDYAEPNFAGAWFRDVSEQRGRTTRGGDVLRTDDGRSYRLRPLISFLVVPLEAGPWTLPEMTLELVARTTRGTYPPVSIRSARTVLDVTPPPAEGRPRGARDANVGWFQVSARVDRARLRVGDSAVIHVVVEGIGHAPGLQVPELPGTEGLRPLEGATSSDVEIRRDGWPSASARRRVPVVATAEGEWTLPGIRFDYFDPWRGTWEQRTTDPLTITVEGEAPEAEETDERDYLSAGAWIDELPDPRPLRAVATGASWWTSPWYPAVVAAPPALWLLTVLGGVARRRRNRAPTSEEHRNARRDELRTLLHEGAPTSTQRGGEVANALRRWAGACTDQTLQGVRVHDLADRLAPTWGTAEAERFASFVGALEEARYGGDADEVARTLDALRAWLCDREDA